MTIVKPTAPEVAADNIPSELKARRRWVCWRYEPRHRDGKKHWAKVPLNTKTGTRADANNPAAMMSFEKALAYYRCHRPDGVGFVFVATDPFSGIDLDDCRDPASGKLQPWAQEIVRQLDTYTEVSPSGTGVKLFLQGKLPPGVGKRKGGVEIYTQDRYFTVTGAHLAGTPLSVEARHVELARLHARLFGEAGGKPAAPVAAGPCPGSDEEIISRAKNARNGPKFTRLWEGDITGKDSPSEADLALLNYLAYWTGGDRQKMEALFNQSALGRRGKWQERADYRRMTLDKALIGWDQFGRPRPDAGGGLTRRNKSNQHIQEESRTLSTVHACRRVKGGLTEQEIAEHGAAMARELADELKQLPCWEATLKLARKLRRLVDDRPERFSQAVEEFCTQTGRDIDEFWYAFLACWEKVKFPEGEDVFSWAALMAEREPRVFNPALRPLYNAVGSIAWHLAQLTYPQAFWLPRERLAPLLGVSLQTVSNVVTLLVKNGVLTCVDSDYSFVKKKAKEYVLVGTPLGKAGHDPAA